MINLVFVAVNDRTNAAVALVISHVIVIVIYLVIMIDHAAYDRFKLCIAHLIDPHIIARLVWWPGHQ